MKSSFFDNIVFFYSFNGIKMRYFECKDIDTGSLEYKFVLMLNSSLIGIKKCQKLSVTWFLFFFIILLLCILFTFFISFSLLSFCYFNSGSLNLNTKVSNLFFIPINCHWNIIFSKIITNKWISINIIDMEIMINGWATGSGAIRNYTNLSSICINWTAFNITYQSLRILKSSWNSWLFNFVSNCKNSDIRFLGPTDYKVVHYLNTTNFTLALRKY